MWFQGMMKTMKRATEEKGPHDQTKRRDWEWVGLTVKSNRNCSLVLSPEISNSCLSVLFSSCSHGIRGNHLKEEEGRRKKRALKFSSLSFTSFFFSLTCFSFSSGLPFLFNKRKAQCTFLLHFTLKYNFAEISRFFFFPFDHKVQGKKRQWTSHWQRKGYNSRVESE